jgi:hypothetical protein
MNDENKKGSKGARNSLWNLSYGHFPVTPFHIGLQKVRGWVGRFFVNEG